MRAVFKYTPPVVKAEVLYSDNAIHVVSKPAGLLSVPGRLEEHKDSLLLRLQAQDTEIRLIHRLDMDTSGLMIFARTAKAQRHIGRQFEQRQVEKIYYAEVAGDVEAQTGTVEFPLMADWPNRPLQMVHQDGKPAITHWTVKERKSRSTIVELRPETGRSHQLRVHMAQIGHPILGDVFYAPDDVVDLSNRLNLHAYKLCFIHPESVDCMEFVAPCPFYSTE